MRRSTDARLRRLIDVRRATAWELAARRSHLEALVKVGNAVAFALRHGAGFDPENAFGMRYAENAAKELDTLPPQSEWERDRPCEGEDIFEAEIARRAVSYRDGAPIDLATAPLFDLLPWCVARGYIEMQSEGENLLLISCRSSKPEFAEQP